MTLAKKKLTASLEDYLEAIYNLIGSDASNVARSKDIAAELEVSRASVTGALKMLSERGLINYKPYGFITLTVKGSYAAKLIAKRHSVIESFFVDILGVNADIAKSAACKAEHALGEKVTDRLTIFMDFVADYNKKTPLSQEFKAYYKRTSEKNERVDSGDK